MEVGGEGGVGLEVGEKAGVVGVVEGAGGGVAVAGRFEEGDEVGEGGDARVESGCI